MLKTFIDELAVGSNDQISRIIRDAAQKNKKREFYRRVNRRDSMVNWPPYLDRGNKSASMQSLTQVTPKVANMQSDKRRMFILPKIYRKLSPKFRHSDKL